MSGRRKFAAFHEAGHVAVGLHYNHKLIGRIIASEDGGGNVKWDLDTCVNWGLLRRKGIPELGGDVKIGLKILTPLFHVSYAGYLAEVKAGDDESTARKLSHGDFDYVKDGFENLLHISDKEAQKQAIDDTRKLIEILWPAITAIAHELENHSLSKDEAIRLYESALNCKVQIDGPYEVELIDPGWKGWQVIKGEMSSFYKKFIRSNHSNAIQGFLEIFYFPHLSSNGDFDVPIDFDNLNDEIRTKILLFTYGVIDAYCQESEVSDDKIFKIIGELDKFIQSTLRVSFLGFLTTNTYREAFNNPDLIKVIEFGGKTYGDFASDDTERDQVSISILKSMVDTWTRESNENNYEVEKTNKFTELIKAQKGNRNALRAIRYEKLRKDMQKNTTFEVENKTVDICINYVLRNILDDKKYELWRDLIDRESEYESSSEEVVDYIFITHELTEQILSGMFHKNKGELTEEGEKLVSLYEEIFMHLQNNTRFIVEEEMKYLWKDIKTVIPTDKEKKYNIRQFTASL